MKLKFLPMTFLLSLFLPMIACSSGVVTNVKIKVLDQSQMPVQAARVEIGFHGGGGYHDLLTNQNGRVTVTDKGLWGQGILMTKEGYYDSSHRTGNGDQDITMELRKIKNPIAMHVYRQAEIKTHIAENPGEPIGYDLMKGDFTAPFGQGETADLIFSGFYSYEKTFYHNFKLTVKFSNDLDGFVPFFITDASDRWRSDVESFYKSDYLTPETGYVNEWHYYSLRNGHDSKPENTFDRSRNYYFRVRTKVDEAGNIESAHYGKIYGEFPTITHYFNPTPNDRNVEFDLLKNLNDVHILSP